jgi:hypothetical protein
VHRQKHRKALAGRTRNGRAHLPQARAAERLIDAYTEHLQLWIKADSHRGKRDRRTVKAYYEAIRAMGYGGGPIQVYIYCRAFKQALDNAPRHAGFVPLGNPPDKPKDREVEFSKKEVLREEVEIY